MSDQAPCRDLPALMNAAERQRCRAALVDCRRQLLRILRTMKGEEQDIYIQDRLDRTEWIMNHLGHMASSERRDNSVIISMIESIESAVSDLRVELTAFESSDRDMRRLDRLIDKVDQVLTKTVKLVAQFPPGEKASR
ncbi:MAG TPA: hypothetical protein VLL72_03910 [Kiloniellales bacterium]|nr:hypothetical protein [Kiloniellales bacterium]